MTWQELSRPIVSGMPVWPGDEPVSVERTDRLDRGDLANVTRLSMSAHAGTHVDAPRHFMPKGRGVEGLDLDALIGPAHLADARGLSGDLGPRELAGLGIPRGTERLLVRTHDGDLWAEGPYSETTLGISAGGARWLIDHRIRLVGVDHMSVAPIAEPEATHLLLLGEGVAVVEGLDLSSLDTGGYDLIVLPLLLYGADGAPARAVARPRPAGEPSA